MATTITLSSSSSQSKNLNQILSTQINRKTLTLINLPQIIRPNSCNSNCINTSINVNYHVYNRRFSSIFATTFSPNSRNYISFCKSSDYSRISSSSLFPLRRYCSSNLRILAMSYNGDQSSNVSQDSVKTIKCMIKGRVQGVFYRNWTIENANELGLKGWVRNRRDGSVEALFSGRVEAVDEMLQRCRRGPQHAMVTALDANPSDEDPGVGFERKPTV